MSLGKKIAGLASVTLILLSVPSAVRANPFQSILDTIKGVNNTIHSVGSTINGTRHTVNGLADTLGISLGSNGNSVNETEPTKKVLQVYELWYKGMPSEEKETVSWLVMEHARNRSVTFDTISTSDWFLQKPINQQSKVAATFFKLQNIIEAVAQDKNRFLAFAFCVNSGNGKCEK